jgi:predicted dehydrogenase
MPTAPDRRGFLTALGAAPVARAAASDRIRVGFIGSGPRGRAHMNILARFPDVDIVSVCDAIEPRMAEAQKTLARAQFPQKPDAVVDYRRVLDRKDVDTVFIATAQHWHGLPFIHACQAGKSIYEEKPLGHSVAEGQAMLKAARKHNITAVMGTQQRAGAHYRKAMEIVRSGKLGKVGLVECWNYADRLERAGRYPDSDPPPGCHWDLWLGPARAVPFNEARLNHNWWWDYGGGVLNNWGPHHFDIVCEAMNAATPLSAVASGGKYVVDDIADTPDVFEASWEFPKFLLTFRSKSFSNFHHLQSRPRHYGIAFYGREAALVIDRFGYEIYANTSRKPYRLYEFPLEPPVETMEGIQYAAPGSPHAMDAQDGTFQRRFLDCVKQGRKPEPDLEYSHRITALCHLANISFHTKRRVRWDAARETIAGDAEAARMLAPPRRKGFELPEV